MTRSIRKQMTAALRQDQPGGWWEATAVIKLPRRVSGTASWWSPGPGYIEAMTATVWAHPADAEHTTAVVLINDADDIPMLLTGRVSADNVLGLGGLCDKPHRIRWLAEPPPTNTPLPADHPAVVYQDWSRRVADDLNQLLRRLGRTRHLVAEQAHVSATPGGGLQATVPICIEAGPWRRHDIRAHTAVLAGVLRHYGHGTRLRFHPRTAEDVIDPRYHRAWQLLSPTRPG